MKLLVFGATGQVAQELARALPHGWHAQFLFRREATLADPAGCAALIQSTDAQAIINAAAYTDVDKAESQEGLAAVINGDAPGAMARAAATRQLPFLHVSSDYVFAGTGDSAFSPSHSTAPLNAYGRSKLAGEQAVTASLGNTLILRTSWVFSAHGKNFVKTMLRLGRERTSLNVVADQFGGPTPAGAIAKALLVAAEKMVNGQGGGIHHFAGSPTVSWADFARAIMADARLDCTVNDIMTIDYPTPAVRPANSRLDCSSFTEMFGVECPDWRGELQHIIAELTA